MATFRLTTPRLVACLLLAAGMLAGCAGPEPGAGAAPTRQATAPDPLHDRLAGQGQRLQVQLTTPQGRPVALNRWFSLRADCSLQDYFRVMLVFPPAHGRVDIRTGQFRPNYPVDTYRNACNAEPRDGIAAFYQPADGYTGIDDMTLKIEAPSGKSWTTDFVVTVR